MKYEQHGILSLILVSCIAMMMMLSFCVQAFSMTIPLEERPAVQCEYPEIVQAAKAFAGR